MRCGRPRRFVWAAAMTWSATVLVAAAAWAVEDAKPRPRPSRRIRPGSRVMLKVGQDAPDVALWPLTAATDANGKEVMNIAAKPVRLSDYKDRAPVVIFSSSYT